MNKEVKKIICLLILITVIPLVKTQTQTGVQVPFSNIAPIFSGIIPNQTWAKNTNLTNSINLNDYFSDNQTLSFTYSSIENVSLIINQTTISNETVNLVSFYPDTNFGGIRNVTFTASDGEKNTSSNLVYLNITQDLNPPLWSNPTKNRQDVYQNLMVTFSSSWTDDVLLESYIFFIKQNGAWTNSTDIGFSGTSASSVYTTQISAAPGSGVEWYFTASDSSGNQNTTEIQNFTVLNNPTSNSSSSSSSNSGSSSSGSSQGTTETVKEQLEKIEKFKIDPTSSFKIETKQGQTNTISIKITNTGSESLSFNIEHSGLEEFEVTLSDSSFTLEPGKSKTLIVEIKAGRYLNPDIYLGKLTISTDKEKVEIPIIIELNKLETDYEIDLIIEDKSKKIKSGQTVFANLTIDNLKDLIETKATIYYAIRDYSGIVVDFKEEPIIVNKKNQEIRLNLTTNKESHVGEYIFYTRLSIENETLLASDIFEIGQRINLRAFIKANLILIILIIILISIIIFIIKYKHNKERLRLLNLYVMVKEMKSLIDSGKIEEAIESYIKIKGLYGEKIYDQSNKELIKNEMKTFSEKYLKMENELKKEETTPLENQKENKIIKEEKIETKEANLKDNKQKTEEIPKEKDKSSEIIKKEDEKELSEKKQDIKKMKKINKKSLKK